jgi:hypothetical protein
MRIFERNWKKIVGRYHDQSYSMDVWHNCLSLTRQYLRGEMLTRPERTDKPRLKLPRDWRKWMQLLGHRRLREGGLLV